MLVFALTLIDGVANLQNVNFVQIFTDTAKLGTLALNFLDIDLLSFTIYSLPQRAIEF